MRPFGDHSGDNAGFFGRMTAASKPFISSGGPHPSIHLSMGQACYSFSSRFLSRHSIRES